jgi:hypothetical protein
VQFPACKAVKIRTTLLILLDFIVQLLRTDLISLILLLILELYSRHSAAVKIFSRDCRNSELTGFYLFNSRILTVFALTEVVLIAIMALGVRLYLLPLVIGVVCVAGAVSGQLGVRSSQ